MVAIQTNENGKISSQDFFRVMDNIMNGGAGEMTLRVPGAGNLTTDGQPLDTLTSESAEFLVKMAQMVEGYPAAAPRAIRDMENALSHAISVPVDGDHMTKPRAEVMELVREELAQDTAGIAALQNAKDPNASYTTQDGNVLHKWDIDPEIGATHQKIQQQQFDTRMGELSARRNEAVDALTEETGVQWQWDSKGGLSAVGDLQTMNDLARALPQEAKYKLTQQGGNVYMGGNLSQPDPDVLLATVKELQQGKVKDTPAPTVSQPEPPPSPSVADAPAPLPPPVAEAPPPPAPPAVDAANLFAGAGNLFTSTQPLNYTPANPEPAPLFTPQPPATPATPPVPAAPVIDATPAPAAPAADAPPASAEPAAPDNTLKNGAGSRAAPDPKVIEMQKLMIAAGFGENLGKWGPNKDGVDGIFRGDTEKTVRAAQAALGLEENGIYDPEKMEAKLKELAAAREKDKAQQAPGTATPTPDAPAPAAAPPPPAATPATDTQQTSPLSSWMNEIPMMTPATPAQPLWMTPEPNFTPIPPDMQAALQAQLAAARGEGGVSHDAGEEQVPATMGQGQVEDKGKAAAAAR